MGKLPPCNLDGNGHTDRCLHAELKSPWNQSRRTNRLTYTPTGIIECQIRHFYHIPSMTPVGQAVGPTTLVPWRLLFSMQTSTIYGMPIFIKIAVKSIFGDSIGVYYF